MSKRRIFRHGTTAEHDDFSGAKAEVTVDTTLNVVVVHDGDGNANKMATAGNLATVDGKVDDVTNAKITDWSDDASDLLYPSEKLVKDAIDAVEAIQADWAETDDTIGEFIKNKPDVQVVGNLVATWQDTTDDTHYASEKLVKDTIDGVIEMEHYNQDTEPTAEATGATWFKTDDETMRKWVTNSDGNGVWAEMGSGSMYNYIAKTEDYTAVANDWVDVDTTDGSFTVTLPESPAENDIVVILDSVGKCGTNALTVARNGNTIMAKDDDLTIDEDSAKAELKFTSNDWRVM